MASEIHTTLKKTWVMYVTRLDEYHRKRAKTGPDYVLEHSGGGGGKKEMIATEGLVCVL